MLVPNIQQHRYQKDTKNKGLCTAIRLGEAHQTEASGQTSTLASGSTDRRGNEIQDGKDGSGGQSQQQNLLQGQRLGRENAGNDTNDQTLHQVLDKASEHLLSIKSEHFVYILIIL